MATKSVLLVDYGSLHRSLTAAGGKAAASLAAHVREWVAGIESGALIDPPGEPRTLAVKRCYAEPGAIGQRSAAFAVTGFEMIDFESEEGEGGAAMTIAIDAMEAASEADASEVILLTAAPGLAHLIKRIKARGRNVVVYAEDATADAYRAVADGIVSASEFVEFLANVGALQEKGKPAISIADRGRIEAFAREMNTATGIPMFSPKTFAELFRLLCDEITTNGYHFQSTAKNVAERLGGGGRTVTSRQVVFVVKGLALKGHVFSTSDTPENLAEVFREQARYLIASAGITLDADRERLLANWITAPGAKPAAAPKKEAPKAIAAPAKPAPSPPVAQKPATVATQPVPQKPAPVVAQPARPVAAQPARPAPVATPQPEQPKPVRKPERRPDPPAQQQPAARQAPAPVKPPERPKSAALPPKITPPPPEPPKPTPADVRAQIAARIAASAKIKPSARPVAPPKPPPPKAAEVAPARKPDPIESSILAAIAQAVDVLVEDSGKSGGSSPAAEPPEAEAEEEAPPPRAQPPERPPARAATPPPQPKPEPLPEPEEGSGDIGDEIQRIVASYNRNRTEGERGS